jgi:hypothetical protein
MFRLTAGQRDTILVAVCLLLLGSGCQFGNGTGRIVSERTVGPTVSDTTVSLEQRSDEKELDKLGGAFYVHNGERVAHLWRIRDEGFTPNKYREVVDFDRVIDCLRRLRPLHRIQIVPEQESFIPRLRQAFPQTEITVWDKKGII